MKSRAVALSACFIIVATMSWLAVSRVAHNSGSGDTHGPVAQAMPQAPSSASEVGPIRSSGASATPAPESTPATYPEAETPARAADSHPHSHLVSAPAATVAAPPKRPWDYHFLESLATAAVGAPIRFELTDGVLAAGTIRQLERTEGVMIAVSGELSTPEAGRFFFQKQTLPGKQGDFAGVVEFPASKSAWRIEPSGLGGKSELVKRRLDEVICMLPPPSAEELAADADEQEIPPLNPSNVPDYVPSYNDGIISLQSRPGAPGVLYIDYRGGYTSTWGGITYDKPNVTNAQIKDVWKRVAEDYMPFTVNVTTDIRVYEAAAENSRQRCICTPTTTAAPGAGGVSYMNSWNWTGDTPNWSFYSTGKSAAEVISHEVGHAVSLGHDGRTTPSEGYYGGQGSGTVGWAPIMGVGYYKPVAQWSKGEYTSANNTEDDLSKITSNNNAVDYRPDDTGGTLATARYLEVNADRTVFAEGVIETTGDTDAFRFTTTGGAVSLTVNPVGDWSDLAIMATLADATDTVIATNNPQTQLGAAIAMNLTSGTYTLRVTGAGRNDPAVDGFSNYASLGYYSISGSATNGVPTTRFSIAENSANGTVAGTVTTTNPSADPLVYTIVSGNTNNAFALDNSGVLTVANTAALNYEALAATTQLTVQFELFVNITNAANPSLNETNRRVVVQVQDVNEAISVTGGAITMLEHTTTGTKVIKVTATDPDQFDFATFSITAGNTGNAFAINSGTGQLTVAADIDVAADTIYNLTVTVTDQGAPALASSVVVPVTVLNIASGYNPGRIVRTYFENISGSTVANLTSNANFPNNPNSEAFLTSFDDQAHADNFGSTIRGYLIPPATGTYQFWIASDDASELRLSTNATPASATVKATVAGWTDPYVWTANASQQSATINLTAGVPYYIEARHKEGGGGDHVAVAWTGPGITRQVIPGLYLAPYYQNYAPKTNATTFAIRENAVPGQAIGTLTSSDVNAQDTFSYTITAGNTGGVFGINAATRQLVVAQPGLLNAATTPAYTLTIQSTDNGTPVLNGSGTITVNVLAATGISETGIVQEIWTGISGTAVSNLTSGNANYPYKPNLRRSLTSFDSGGDYSDNYGSRIRAKFIPPTTDSYRFYVSSDDASSLLYSANASGSGAAQIASIGSYTSHNVWTTYASQTSAVKSLVAGQAVYLETLQKEGGGGDHVSVAYTNSTVTTPTVIPGSMLQPFDINAAPVFSPASYSYNLSGATATAGMVLGTVTATEPNGEPLVYAILSGNSQGAFAINSGTGVVTVANPAGLSNGDANLQVAAQDGGLGGVYPFVSATATVVVHVTASNSAPTFVSNPVVKPGASESVAYSQTLAGSATDVNPGDVLTFSKISGPSWLAVASNGDLTGTPGVGTDGLNSFVVRVTDSSGIFAEATLNITVTGINHPPAFTANPITATAMYGVPVTGAITATDPNAGDTLTYSKTSGPAWLGVASNGTLTGTPASTDLGVNVFSVHVADAVGATADATLNVTVSDPVLYFDVNGTTAGSGAPGSATWSEATTNWSATSAGTGATQTWVGGALGRFSAGTDAGTSTITVSGTQTLRGFTVEEGTPTLTGGTLSLTGTTPTITTGSGIGATISSVIAGSATLKKDGDGSLTLNGATSNTYSGSTTFASNGHLILSKTGGAVAIPGDLLMAAPGTRGIVSTTVDNQFGAGTVLRFTSTGDTRLELKGTTQTLGGIENTGVSGVYHCVQHSEFGTPAAVDGTSQLILNVAGGNSFTFNTAAGSLRDYNGGVLSLVKNGTGTQTFSGGNVSYTGSTTVSQGKLTFAGTYGSPALSIASGATLELTVASGTTDYATSTISGAGTLLKTGAGASRWGTQAGTFTLGAGSLVDVRTGTLIAGSSSNENWSGNLSSLNVNSGATINELTYGPAVFDALTGAGSVAGTGTSTLTLGANNTAAGTYNTVGTATFSGVISSVSSLIKTGTGSQTLSGANTYTGTTTVSQGNLIVTGSLANSATTVAAAGTLGGTGTIAGTVANNGTLAPGTTAAGSLTVTNTLTLAPSSAIAWQVANWTGTAGTGYDKLTVSALALTATSANPVTIRISQQALTNFTETSKTFTLLQSTAAISGFDPAKFVLDTSGFTSGLGTWAVQLSGNNLVLAYTRANTTPTFATDPIVRSGTQGVAMSGSISAVDPDIGETLTYAKVSGPTWLAVASNGALSGTPANANVGANSVTVRVTDSFNATSTATLNVTVANVNDAPVFTNSTITGTPATEDAAYTGTLAGTATDPDAGDTLTFSKITGPTWLTVASNGGLSGTPLNANVGSNSFTVRVTDAGGLTANATLNIAIANVNDAPVFTNPTITGTAATEDAAYTGTLAGTATDQDAGDTFTYSKVSGPSWLTVASNGGLSGTPANADVGSNSFTVLVTDAGGLTGSATLNITVTNTNDAPVFAANPISENAAEDSAFSGQLSASDVDAVDSLTYSKVSGPVWLTVSATGVLGGTPLNDNIGLNTFTVQVTDTSNTSATATLNVTVSNTNDAPVFTNPTVSGTAATEDTAYTGTLAGTASDPDAGDTFTYSKVSGPSWLAVASNGELSGTPANADVGSNSFTVRVTDAGGLTGDATLNITVANTNDAPVFAANPISENAAEDSAFSGQISTSDPDTGDILTCAKLSGPSWLTVSSSGALAGTPLNSDVGLNVFSIQVTDSSNVSVTAILNVNVANTNDAPTFAADPIPESATEDSPFSGQLAASDVDAGDTLTYSKASGPAWLTVSSSGVLGGTPLNADVGPNVFTVQVTDTSNSTTTATLNITVANTNDAPAFAADPIAESATEDSAFSGQLAASDADAGDSLAYLKLSGPEWLTVSSSGALAGTPLNQDVGPNVFSVQVTDSSNVSVTATLNVTVANSNDAPAFAVDPVSENATEDSEFSGQLSASDPDASDTLTYSKLSGPAWLTVSSTGVLGGTPLNPDVGPNTFTVQVTDSANSTDTATLNIAVSNTNDPPVFASSVITGAAATLDSSYSGSLAGTATDPDTGDAFTYSKSSGPAWLSVAANGSLSGTPSGPDAGSNIFSVLVTDAGGLSSNATLQIHVAAVGTDSNGNGILDSWETTMFGNADPGNNPADEDDDHDGLSNLLEFALGTHPLQANASPLTTGFASVGPNTYLQLTIPKNAGATNLTYTVEVCGDIAGGTWSAVPTFVVSDTPAQLIVRDTEPVGGIQRRFLRLKVHTLP